MRKIHVQFVTAKGWDLLTDIGHKIVGGTVKAATNSRYAHAALVLDYDDMGPVTYEMLAPGITRTAGRVYSADNTEAFDEVDIPIADAAFVEILAALQKWLDNGVGYALWTGCVAAGVEANVNEKAGNWIDEHWSEQFDTMMCSEMVARCIRIAYPGFMSGIRAGAIPPDDQRGQRQGLRDGCYALLATLASDPG